MRVSRIPLPVLTLLVAGCAGSSTPNGSASPPRDPSRVSALESLTQGETWMLESMANIDPLPDGDLPTLQFLTQGRVIGNTGCNQLNGRYELEGVAVDFAGMATTRMACQGEIGELEQRFLEMLDGARFLELGLRYLDLFSEDGGRVARFIRR